MLRKFDQTMVFLNQTFFPPRNLLLMLRKFDQEIPWKEEDKHIFIFICMYIYIHTSSLQGLLPSKESLTDVKEI